MTVHVRSIQRVGKFLGLAVHIRPQGLGPGFDSIVVPLRLTVVEKRSEQTAVDVIQNGNQEMLIELEGIWELERQGHIQNYN